MRMMTLVIALALTVSVSNVCAEDVDTDVAKEQVAWLKKMGCQVPTPPYAEGEVTDQKRTLLRETFFSSLQGAINACLIKK